MRINWLIEQRYLMGGFSQVLICANFEQKAVQFEKLWRLWFDFDRPIVYSPIGYDLKPQENSWLAMQARSSGILFKQLPCLIL